MTTEQSSHSRADVNPYWAPQTFSHGSSSRVPYWWRIPSNFCVLYAGALFLLSIFWAARSVIFMQADPTFGVSVLLLGSVVLYSGVLAAILAARAWRRRRGAYAVLLSFLLVLHLLSIDPVIGFFIKRI
ncbi:MAG: hypothetical protein KY475_15785 [Planctomycetes bacterium]|nr:hypothetical protein [Planctomycetota bacterium]